MGIEPTTTAWKAVVLPLNYARILGGFNPLLIYINISCRNDQHLLTENFEILPDRLSVRGYSR